MIPCRECGKDSGWSQELIDQPLFGGNIEVAVCDRCCDEYHEKQEEEDKPATFDLEPIDKMIPPLYLETDYNKLPNEAKSIWAHIKYWTPEIQKGIYLLGSSRTGKTRTLCLLLKKLHNDGVAFKLFLAGQFHAALSEAKRSRFFTSWRDEMVQVPVLAIDDLFAEKLTETTQAGLFELIEQRMANKKPTLITTQVRRGDAVKQFADPRRGEALLNRLKETCDLYLTNADHVQTKMEV